MHGRKKSHIISGPRERIRIRIVGSDDPINQRPILSFGPPHVYNQGRSYVVGWSGCSPGLGAAWKVADVSEGSSVVILGLGTVGLSVAQAAKLRGASRIIGVDTNPGKFETGK
ncbi:hypothetical protein QQ045_031458 [Rhodiola kirilowii]